jgi:hypothetical protein
LLRPEKGDNPEINRGPRPVTIIQLLVRTFVVVTSPSIKTLVRKFTPGIFAMPTAFIVICVEKAPDAHPLAEVTYLADCTTAAQNIMPRGLKMPFLLSKALVVVGVSCSTAS